MHISYLRSRDLCHSLAPQNNDSKPSGVRKIHLEGLFKMKMPKPLPGSKESESGGRGSWHLGGFSSCPGESDVHYSLRITPSDQWFSNMSKPQNHLEALLKPIVDPHLIIYGLSRWFSSRESACQCRRHGFDPWDWKIPWSRK